MLLFSVIGKCNVLTNVLYHFADASSQPVVSFPKTLLNLTHSSNITSVKAFLTIPRLMSEQGGFLATRGIMSNKSGI